MSADIEFTDDEIREELARLGYRDVPEDKLIDFKKDLMKLITTDRSRNTSIASSSDEYREDEPVYRSRSQGSIRPSTHAGRNFTNHGSQWLDKGSFQEDWHYKGRKGSTSRNSRLEINVPESYCLYELPPRHRRDDNNCNEGDGSEHDEEVEEEYLVESSSYSETNDDESYEVKEETNTPNPNPKSEPATRPASRKPSYHNEQNARDFAATPPLESREMNRKTFRIAESGCRKVDGSMNQNDTAGIFEIYEKIRNMAMRDCECGKTRPKSCETKPPYRMSGVNKCPSVIISKVGRPHTRNLVRCRPGERLKMYNKLWQKQPPIGEDTRLELRKQVRRKMSEKHEVQLDKKVYVPNTYEVPSTKQRNNLRWRVRTALENYRLPPHGVYHDVI